MVISAAGAVDHAALVKAAEKSFSKLPSGGKSAADLVKEVGGCVGGKHVGGWHSMLGWCFEDSC
jgi:hypothetical protein